MILPYEATMHWIAELEAKYDYRVVGESGRVYSDVPKEVWDHVPSTHKRIVAREK